MDNSVFGTLNGINVNDHTEKKKSGNTMLTYLSWSWAVAEVKKRYPDFTYEIERFDNNLPYVYDPLTGYMVFTKVTIEGITHEMWLPCMDANNRAMMAEPYQVTFANGKTITVAKATMFDINKTIMRCLVKNLAMFGLGLYIYAGEDLPDDAEPEQAATTKKRGSGTRAATKEDKAPVATSAATSGANAKKLVFDYCARHGINIQQICTAYKVSTFEEMPENYAQHYIDYITKKGGDINA